MTTGIIQTHPQAKISTTVTTSTGSTRRAKLTTKQFLFTKMKDFEWVSVSTLNGRVSRSGLRRALTELRQSGYGIETRYSPANGSISQVRLTSIPNVTPFRSN